MNRKISICDIINISSIIQNKEKYKARDLLRDRCHCCSDFRALVPTIPDTSNSEPILLLMMEGRSRANVATLRRHVVATSRCYRLLTFIMVDPTSRRCGVTTWGRRDVGTSRRSSHFHALLSSAPICFQNLLFSPHLHLHSQNLPYSDIEL